MPKIQKGDISVLLTLLVAILLAPTIFILYTVVTKRTFHNLILSLELSILLVLVLLFPALLVGAFVTESPDGKPLTFYYGFILIEFIPITLLVVTLSKTFYCVIYGFDNLPTSNVVVVEKEVEKSSNTKGE